MDKAIENYINKLNQMVGSVNDGFCEAVSKDKCIEIRNEAITYLLNIFEEYGWSEEFVISFSAYCNFFILHGLHISLDNDFGLQNIFDFGDMDSEDKKYLNYIYQGIWNQDIEYFEKAIDMGIYDFDTPYYYIYLFSFLELCLRDDIDFMTDEGREDIYAWYCEMENAKMKISGDLKVCVRPIKLSFEEEKKVQSSWAMLLPQIIISDQTRRIALAANSDLELLSKISGIEIDNFEKMIEGMKRVSESGDANICVQYLFFVNEFVKRTIYAKEYGDYELFNGCDSEMRDHVPVNRRVFLKLPVWVSESQYRKIALAEQIKLNYEKEILIQKNEKMVEDYSHSVENVIKPALISEVANCLREDEKNRDIYNKIMYAYYNEVITQNECRLLKMVHNVSVSKGAIRESMTKSKLRNGSNGISVSGLMYKAINQIALQLTEDSQKTRYMFIMNKMKQSDIDSSDIDNALWNSAKETDAVYKLFSDKLSFAIDVSDELKNVWLNEEELGTSFLYTRLVELITNALTYGDYSEKRKFSLNAYVKETDSADNYIVFQMINAIGDRSFSKNRIGNGLNATGVMLERINFPNPDMERFVLAEEKDSGIYITEIYVDADLYM